MRCSLLLALMIACGAATAATAAQWKKDKAGTYEYMTIVSDKNALTVECYSHGPQKPSSLALHYWPLCASSSCGTYIGDDTQLGNVMLDKQLFAVGFNGGDTDDLQVEPKSVPQQEFMDALAESKSITVYSAQIVPNSTSFKNIRNPQALKAYYQRCLQKAAEQTPAPPPPVGELPVCRNSAGSAQCVPATP